MSLLALYGSLTFILGKDYSKFTNFLKTNLQEEKGQKAIENPIERPLPYADIQSGSVISSFVKLCSNTTFGFEITYPKDWFTTYDSDEQRCTFFAPFSFIINSKTESSLIPIKIEVVNIDQWLDTVKFYENPNDFQNVESSQNILIVGKSIKKIKAISTGLGTIPRGFIKISHLVFDAKTPLVIYYQQHDAAEDTAIYEKIIEEMTESLKIF